jgi:hypothetical protein
MIRLGRVSRIRNVTNSKGEDGPPVLSAFERIKESWATARMKIAIFINPLYHKGLKTK